MNGEANSQPPSPKGPRTAAETAAQLAAISIPAAATVVSPEAAAITGVFTAVASAISSAFSARDLRYWQEVVHDAVSHLYAQGSEIRHRLAHLEGKLADELCDIINLTRAAAHRDSNQRKLRALRNAVVNTVLATDPGEAAVSRRRTFILLVDQLTVSHLRLLKFVTNPARWFLDRALEGTPNPNQSWQDWIVAALPEFSTDPRMVEKFWHDLKSHHLISGDQALILRETHPGRRVPTAFGVEFLAFIETPSDLPY